MRIWAKLATCTAVAGLALGVFPAVSPAPTPPADCGFMQVAGMRLNVKTNHVRCKPARKYTRRYLKDGSEPPGFTCTDYGSETELEFRCTKGAAAIYAIRR